MGRDIVWLSNHLELVDELYERYCVDPNSVDPSWQAVFKNGLTELPPQNGVTRVGRQFDGNALWPLLQAFRTYGHLEANVDPLGLMEKKVVEQLDPANYGLSQEMYGQTVGTGGLFGLTSATVGEVIALLRQTYCDSVGVEFMHISSPSKKEWLLDRIERLPVLPPAETRVAMLRELVNAESFEHFIQVKYPGTKRFSLEGSESMIPLLERVLAHAGQHGVIETVIGMAHRGRLNVLCQTMGRLPREMFADFEDSQPENTLGGGDVKYHLGYSCDRVDTDGNQMHLSLTFNPSHLEAVDPVVVGRVRAKQRRHGDWEHRKIMGVLIHGDAAFAGQGLVTETLQLSNLHGYRTGGTVHIVVNNQIGFTATAREQRSTLYSTGVAKMLQCPIFHVNGDDIDAVARVTEIAMEYRNRFGTDVVIDLLCYRKYGHNEMDEPAFTQPVMYERIRGMTSTVDLYGQRLADEGVIGVETLDEMRKEVRTYFEGELEVARTEKKRPEINAMKGYWSQFQGGADLDAVDLDAEISREKLEEITKLITTPPDDMKVHRKIEKLLGQRLEMGTGKRNIDWGMGELLAYGSLLMDGIDVRLTGQDSSRGTFSHRHAIITDVENGREHLLLNNVRSGEARARIYDSPLSEAGVLGFEFGYSLDYPDALVIWEAQFGDFVNGAQVIIDQFITASEDKWNRLSGLVMLLPHGYEGQGPEHSSARLERFLQACAEDNIQVIQPTTTAQIFHALRRQVLRPYRKPLVVFSPKSLLRLPEAASSIDELANGGFKRVLADPTPPKKAERLILCTGKIFYSLDEERKKRGDETTAIVRLEQLYPWRAEDFDDALPPFDDETDIVWAQEEPMNMGAAQFVLPFLQARFGPMRVRTASRDESASPATGSHKAHQIEEVQLMNRIFGVRPEKN